MKAVILNSGRGERLRPLTRYTPKTLIEIGNKPLLGHQMDNLIGSDIGDIIITTGPFENKIKKYLDENYPSTNVTYVRNPKYRTTNYLYSMWLTRKLIDEDIILLHGDLLFDKILIKRLVAEACRNCVLINKKIKPPEKDFKAIIVNNRVVKIGVEFFGKNAFFSAPLYKFSKLSFLFWLEEIGKSLKKGNLRIYAEQVLNEISSKIPLHPVYFTEEICLEIDTVEDLKLARKLSKNCGSARISS